MAAESFSNNTIATTLSAAIPDGVTASISVASAAGYPTSGQYRILIDSELMLVTSGQGTTTWGVTRGVEGTTAVSHLNGASVRHILTAAALTNMGPSGSFASLSAAGLTGAVAASRYVGATAAGAPTSGTFAVGDFVIDQVGRVIVCTTAGSPGTWRPIGAGSWKARAYLAGAYSTTAGSFTAIPFDTIDYDPNGNFTTGAGAKYTAPVVGFYAITAGVSWTGGTASETHFVVAVFKNGAQVRILSSLAGLTFTVADGNGSGGACILQLAAGDVITIQVFNNYITALGTGIANTSAEFHYLSAA